MNRSSPRARALLAAPLALLLVSAESALAQSGPNLPVTPGQRATAQQVASQGVPLSALAPGAPDEYTVRRGDTLWSISGLFLKSPWRWPELWGMNLKDIRNPHLIYPGQHLYLERLGDRAVLRARRLGDGQVGQTIRVSPRTRIEQLSADPLPTLQPHLIEPFLSEPLVVEDDTFQRAPRIVAMSDHARVMMARGDRIYARGEAEQPLLAAAGRPDTFRVFRNARPLKDPRSGELLGMEGHYVGKVVLVRGETTSDAAAPGASQGETLPVPATLDVVSSKEEMRPGDRLLPDPPRDYRSYVPQAPDMPVDAQVVAVYGDSVLYAGQNQVLVINKGLRDGIRNGHVLALQAAGTRMIDKTDANRATIQLPDERNGLAMVFRPFERVSYALVMQITQPVQIGDKLTNPR